MYKIFISLISLLLIISCSENLSTAECFEESLSIFGRIQNMPDYENHPFNKIYCYYTHVPDSISFIDDCHLLGNGDFSLYISAPSASQLRTFSPFNYNSGSMVYTDSIKFDTENVLFTEINFRASNPQNIHFPVNNLNLADLSKFKVGDYLVSYYYFSEACKITGFSKVNYNGTGPTVKTQFNLVMKKGWNKITTTLKQVVELNNDYYSWEVSNSNNIRDNWEIMAFPSFGQKSL